jgi:iron-sulfur cluster assembly accessory protein
MTVSVTLSAAAAARIIAIAPEGGLRVGVLGGGCSGFSYDIKIAQAPAADDMVITRDGARLFVDAESVALLEGSEVDWVDELIGSSFKIKNPNAKTSCGCGVSFSV